MCLLCLLYICSVCSARRKCAVLALVHLAYLINNDVSSPARVCRCGCVYCLLTSLLVSNNRHNRLRTIPCFVTGRVFVFLWPLKLSTELLIVQLGCLLVLAMCGSTFQYRLLCPHQVKINSWGNVYTIETFFRKSRIGLELGASYTLNGNSIRSQLR